MNHEFWDMVNGVSHDEVPYFNRNYTPRTHRKINLAYWADTHPRLSLFFLLWRSLAFISSLAVCSMVIEDGDLVGPVLLIVVGIEGTLFIHRRLWYRKMNRIRNTMRKQKRMV